MILPSRDDFDTFTPILCLTTIITSEMSARVKQYGFNLISEMQNC